MNYFLKVLPLKDWLDFSQMPNLVEACLLSDLAVESPLNMMVHCFTVYCFIVGEMTTLKIGLQQKRNRK